MTMEQAIDEATGLLERPEVRERIDRVRGQLAEIDTQARRAVQDQPMVAVGAALAFGYSARPAAGGDADERRRHRRGAARPAARATLLDGGRARGRRLDPRPEPAAAGARDRGGHRGPGRGGDGARERRRATAVAGARSGRSPDGSVTGTTLALRDRQSPQRPCELRGRPVWGRVGGQIAESTISGNAGWKQGRRGTRPGRDSGDPGARIDAQPAVVDDLRAATASWSSSARPQWYARSIGDVVEGDIERLVVSSRRRAQLWATGAFSTDEATWRDRRRDLPVREPGTDGGAARGLQLGDGRHGGRQADPTRSAPGGAPQPRRDRQRVRGGTLRDRRRPRRLRSPGPRLQRCDRHAHRLRRLRRARADRSRRPQSRARLRCWPCAPAASRCTPAPTIGARRRARADQDHDDRDPERASRGRSRSGPAANPMVLSAERGRRSRWRAACSSSALIAAARPLRHARVAARAHAARASTRRSRQQIDDTRRGQGELRELSAALEARVAERTAELNETIVELETFNYSVSHDLRGPLGAVINFAAILQEDYGDRLDATAKDHLQRIVGSASSAVSMMDALLAYSRSGRTELRKTQLDMPRLVQEVCDELSRARAAARVRGQDRRPARRHRRREHDPLRVRQPDRQRLQVRAQRRGAARRGRRPRRRRTRRSTSSATRASASTCASRRSSSSVFERLHAADGYEGHGVGLAIVARMVRRHGGRVWAQGAVGKGATFYFTVACHGSGVDGRRRAEVLLVEDDANDVAVAMRAFRRHSLERSRARAARRRRAASTT